MKSNVTSNIRDPSGMGRVLRPRALTSKVMCHEWFTQGASASLVLPTIWVQRWSVA